MGVRGKKLVPYRRFVIETDLPPEAVLRLLAECVETRLLWNPSARNQKPYHGRLDGCVFWMRRSFWHFNSFQPVVRGAVEPRGTGALVRVRMRPFLIGLGFAIVWMGMCAFGSALVLLNYPLQPTSLLPLAMLAFGYLVLMVGFVPEATRVTNFLCGLLKGRVVEDV